LWIEQLIVGVRHTLPQNPSWHCSPISPRD
jgi:hypothetical protein